MEFKNIFCVLVFIVFSHLADASIKEKGSGLGIGTACNNIIAKSYDVKEFKYFSDESDEKTIFKKLKSSVTPTKKCLLPSIVYNPILTAAYTLPYAGYKTMQYFGDKKNGNNKLNVIFLMIEKSFLTLDKKINEILENQGNKVKAVLATFTKVKNKKTLTDSNTTEEETELQLQEGKSFAQNFRLWTRAILTGITMWYAVKLTDKLLRSEKLGKIGQKYTNWQKKYNTLRVLTLNKAWDKMIQFFDKYIIPGNATITYTYRTSVNP